MNTLRTRLMLKAARRMHRWRRAMTLGARVVVFDTQSRVLLVRHTYAAGWLFPGGGVEFGETGLTAAIREIQEEAGIRAQTAPDLFGVYSNHRNYPGDHLLLYTLRSFTRDTWKPTREIAAADFFHQHMLPDDTTGGTRRRLAEIHGTTPISAEW